MIESNVKHIILFELPTEACCDFKFIAVINVTYVINVIYGIITLFLKKSRLDQESNP